MEYFSGMTRSSVVHTAKISISKWKTALDNQFCTHIPFEECAPVLRVDFFVCVQHFRCIEMSGK